MLAKDGVTTIVPAEKQFRLHAAARHDLQSDPAAPGEAAADAVPPANDMVITLTNDVFLEFVNSLNAHMRDNIRHGPSYYSANLGAPRPQR